MYIKEGELVIRNAEERDAGLLCARWNDGGVMTHAGFPNGVNTTEDIIKADLQNDDDLNRRLIIESDGAAIGEMNYRTPVSGVAEIGIKICDFGEQGKGKGARLLKMLISRLFTEMGYEKIVLDTNLNNVRAQHVYEKIGFRRLRVNHGAWRDQLGKPQSFVDYELRREGF
jgi:RimJ/RimL family protein N-acetyltransferase